MSLLKKIAPSFIRDRYSNVQARLQNLETAVRHLNTAVDAMLVSPRFVAGDEIGFNGQWHRKAIFKDIISSANFDAIIETGTWLGNTTGFMRLTSGKPVFSCELNPRFHALAKMRLANLDQIHLELKDSRQFLQGLQKSLPASQMLFIYLDAHWYDDLPLVEEMDLIGSGWGNYVIMVDDFCVPGDNGYAFDNYGHGKALELSMLENAVKKYNLAVFFPAARSSEETGGKCGCVVLAPHGPLSQKLTKLPSLSEWKS
jgi:hypothetical protein